MRINELVTGVGIALGTIEVSACSGFMCPEPDSGVVIACLVTAVGNALGGCQTLSAPTATPTPPATVPSATPTLTGGMGYTISGCVNEFPGTPCGQIGVTVQLDPLGLTSLSDGTQYFRFENIPPGNYVLTVLLGCNPFGCWEEVPVTVTDQDVFVTIDLIPNPTPTHPASPTDTPLRATPTPTVTPVPGIDLRPSDVIAYGEYQSGCRGPLAYLSVCVENTGRTSSGPFTVRVQPGNDRFEIGDLDAQTRVCTIRPFTGWEASGYHTFDVIVDVDDTVDEADEENNSTTVRVLRPTIPPTCPPSATPTRTNTPSPTLRSTPTPTPSPTPTATGSRTPSLTPSATPTCFFPPRPTPTVSFTIHPDTPKVGDTVQVSAFVNTGNAGPPGECVVSGTSPVFADIRITGCGGGQGGGTATFEMKAVQAGSAMVRLGFSFEIAVEVCDPLNPIYQFVRGSAILEVTVAPGDTSTGTPTVTPTASVTETISEVVAA